MATLTRKQLDAIENAMYAADCEIRQYSGRAMFGQQCIGLAIDSVKNLTAFFVQLAQDDVDLAIRMSREIRMDQLGRGEIAYWPSISMGDEEE